MTMIVPKNPRKGLISRTLFDDVSDSLFGKGLGFVDDLLNEVANTFDDGIHWVDAKLQYPKVDVIEYKNRTVIDATVPGLTKNDIEIKMKDLEEDPNFVLLSICYNKTEKVDDGLQEGKDYKFGRKEIHRSSFQRMFTIPKKLYDLEKVSTKLESGILTLTIPKVIIEEQKKEKPEWKNIIID